MQPDHPERVKVVGRIADHLLAQHVGHPLRVAVDGPTAAGKTSLADELAALVRTHGRPVIRLSMDHFHHPRAHRYRQGRDSALGYYQDAYDLPRFAEAVLNPLGPSGDLRYLPALHDPATDQAVHPDPVTAAADAVLLVDGTFLQSAALDGGWDEVVYVDTELAAARQRGTARDAPLFGDAAAADAAYRTRYHAACQLYLDERAPADRASIVVANTDLARPVLRRIGGTAAETVSLFSYGTLQQQDVQRATFGRELAGRADALPGHRTDWVTITDPAVIAASGSDRHPIVRASADPADAVAGTVLTLTTEELAAADHYEVVDYRRVLLRLSSGARAWAYLAADVP